MKSVNVHEAKTHLSQLLNEVESGAHVTIARAGKPVAVLAPLQVSERSLQRRIGFLGRKVQVPDDFDQMFSTEIAEMFGAV